MANKKIFSKIILWGILSSLLVFIIYGIFFVWKINKVENQINSSPKNVSLLETIRSLTPQKSRLVLKNQNHRINILLLGIAGEKKPGRNLTDTIMVVSVNTQTNQVAMLSIPRDLYVKIPKTNFQTKINAVYQYGLSNYPASVQKSIQPLEKTIEKITSLPIDYWAVMNFDGFQKTIDAIGGINITNQRDILDTRYPGPNYSYETFELSKGFHHLNGAVALQYARMRHDDPEGDFGRAKRQQQVLQATKNKIFSTKTFLNVLVLNKLFNTLGNNLKTNIALNDLGGFLTLLKKVDTNNITNVVVDAWNKNSLLKVSHIFYGPIRAFILVPRVGNWSEVQELAQNIFNTDKLKHKRQAILQEQASVAIINESGTKQVAKNILSLLKNSFGYQKTFLINNPKKELVAKNTVYDLTNGAKPFTLNELASKLPATVSYSLPTYYQPLIAHFKVDLVLILGQEAIKRYTTHDTLKEYNQASDFNNFNLTQPILKKK